MLNLNRQKTSKFIFFALSAFSVQAFADAKLSLLGEKLGNMGQVILLKNSIVVTERGKAYSPLKPDEPISPIPSGKVIVKDLDGCQNTRKDSPVAEAPGERTVDWKPLPSQSPGDAVVTLVRTGEANPVDPLDYKPFELRLYVGGQLKATHAFAAESYPCSVIAQDLNGDSKPEIAVTWISVGNRYSVGAHVFQWSESKNQ